MNKINEELIEEVLKEFSLTTKFFDEYLQGIHTMRGGTKIKIVDMSDSHLINAYLLFKNKWRSLFFSKELMNRGFDVKTIDFIYSYKRREIDEYDLRLMIDILKKSGRIMMSIEELIDLTNEKISEYRGKQED
jgi:hypothetical protein